MYATPKMQREYDEACEHQYNLAFHADYNLEHVVLTIRKAVGAAMWILKEFPTVCQQGREEYHKAVAREYGDRFPELVADLCALARKDDDDWTAVDSSRWTGIVMGLAGVSLGESLLS